MNWFGTLAKSVGINITIKDRSAQLLLSAAVFILAIGIAWSFIKGFSTITYKPAPKHPQIEKNGELGNDVKTEVTAEKKKE